MDTGCSQLERDFEYHDAAAVLARLDAGMATQRHRTICDRAWGEGGKRRPCCALVLYPQS